MADTEGFEPSKDREALASLAGRWFQPLTHVSKQLARRRAITIHRAGCNG